MNIIQTLWTRNSPNYLSEKCGWLSPEYNLMSWALSCLQLRQFYPSVTLYADSVSAKLLIDTLELPYTNVVYNLDKLNSYHPKLWALPKVHTYSVQDKPFLHIDGDVFIWKAFDKEFLNNGLIAQNKESATGYYESIMKLLEAGLQYFPEEIIQERKNNELIYAYNAGIFGGTDISFFQEYCKKAFEFVDANLFNLDKINVVDFNIFFEQYLFYCLVKKEKKDVAVLFTDLIDDTQYTGFGDFFEVPYKKTFLHLLGNYKKSSVVCQQMADRLRNDYPEYYYKIIALYKTHKLPLFRDFYFSDEPHTKADLIKRYNTLKAASDNDLKNAVVIERMRDDSAFLKPIEESKLTDVEKEDYKKFKKSLNDILQNDFARLSEDELYARDIKNTDSFEYIFGDAASTLNKIIIKQPDIRIIKSKYRRVYTYQMLFEDDLALEEIITVVIPECDKVGYSMIFIDELDELILENLNRQTTIHQLLESVKYAFDADDLNNSLQEFQILILGRIKKGLLHKIIKCVKEEENFL